MEPKNISNKIKDKEQSELISSNNKLKNLKSDYFIQKIFDYIHKRKTLETIKYNKSIQKRLNININDYKAYSEKFSSIEIEIIPMKNGYGRFIHITKDEKEYYHIYYKDNKEEEIKRNIIYENDNVSKIFIFIDYQVKSFCELFLGCGCVEYVYFKKIYRNNITNMSYMFEGCSSLKEVNFNNFKTNNVTDMNSMFRKCSSLKKLNLNNFNTSNVTDMNSMFEDCSSLKELNINNFNTSNVTDMSSMFSGCKSLNELNLNNFNTNNVTNMSYMFNQCSSLNELNLNNFNTNNVADMRYMFNKCSDELKLKIKNKFNKFKEEAFKDYENYYE